MGALKNVLAVAGGGTAGLIVGQTAASVVALGLAFNSISDCVDTDLNSTKTNDTSLEECMDSTLESALGALGAMVILSGGGAAGGAYTGYRIANSGRKENDGPSMEV